VNVSAWCRRLQAQLPGWHVWRSGTPARGWYAVPAPPGTGHTEALGLPHRLGPYREPQELRAVCRQRYGWDDYCQTCGILARDCGHRQPETAHR
jgi:hypothetical protein